MLPVAPYFRAGDSRIAGICHNQYTTTLEMLTKTSDKVFKSYLTRKTQGWFRRRGRDEAAAAPAASLAPGAGAGGAGAATPARAPTMQVSDDDEDGGGSAGGPPASLED